jgi:tetratricopeptide (TPR) repeat protein
VGKSNIGKWLVARRLGCHGQCEYCFALVPFVVLTFLGLEFTVPRVAIYWAICDHLEMANRLMDVIECFQHMNNELAGKTNTRSEQVKWVVGEGGHACRCRQCLCDRSRSDFRLRYAEKLEYLGDAAVDAQQYNDAITQYSAALSLDLAVQQDILIKRSKVYVAMGLWGDALDDTNQVRDFCLVQV